MMRGRGEKSVKLGGRCSWGACRKRKKTYPVINLLPAEALVSLERKQTPAREPTPVKTDLQERSLTHALAQASTDASLISTAEESSMYESSTRSKPFREEAV